MHSFDNLLKEKILKLSGPANLIESMRYSLLLPGKRIRPRLLMEVGRALEANDEACRLAAVAIETIHCFTLVHDDLPCLDNDDFRRGKPSNHKVFGEDLALLAGDALLVGAFEIFSDCSEYVSPKAFSKSFRALLKGIGPAGVIGGQAAELLLSNESKVSEIEKVHALKTGALFEAAIMTPTYFVELDENSKEFQGLLRFSKTFGKAFQIVDDLDDREGPASADNVFHHQEGQFLVEKTRRDLDESLALVFSIWPDLRSSLSEMTAPLIKKLS